MAKSSRSGAPFPSYSEASWKYDVFLSFRGSDTRRNFTEHLYTALERAGVHVFRDEIDLRTGQAISVELLKAIEESKISIVVFSNNYADSTWCLEELAMIMEYRSMYGQKVFPVFYDVEPKDVRKQMGRFAEAFSKHESSGRFNSEKVERWRSALSEAANLTGLVSQQYRSEVELIREIVKVITEQLMNLKVDVEELPEVDDRQLVNPEVNATRFPVGIKSWVEDLDRHLHLGSDEVKSSRSGPPFPSYSTPSWKYDVFLSFRGLDTRRNFTEHLYTALEQAGFHVFRDEIELSSGQTISLRKAIEAIEESKISIVVFSNNYADSTWCLEELAMIMECRSMYGQKVFPVFYDVEPSVVRKQMGRFAEAFSKHESSGRFNSDKVKRWRSALTEAANYMGWVSQQYWSEVELIREIVKVITEQLMNLKVDVEELPEVDDRQLVNPEVNVARFPVGIKSRVEDLVRHLHLGTDEVLIVGIFGVLGIGKTAVAKAMYDQYSKSFDGACFLVNVRDTIKEPNGLISLQEQLHDALETKINIGVVSAGAQHIEKRVLVMIDDIDERAQLNQLAINRDRFGSGSRIVVITREESLLKQLRVDTTYSPQPMNTEEANELFSWHAFGKCSPDEEYSEHSRAVVAFLGGLPHHLTITGDDLYGKDIKKWQLLKRCIANEEARILKDLFLYCYSLFPTGYEFRKDDLVQLWIAEGFIVDKYAERMEDTGISYFNYLEKEGYFFLSRCDFGVDFDSVSTVACNSNNLYRINTDRADVAKNKTSRDHYSKGMNTVSVSENVVEPVSISQHTASQAEDELKAVDEPFSSENIISALDRLDSNFRALDLVSASDNTLSRANDLRARKMVVVPGYTASELDYFRVVDVNLNGASETTRHLSLTSKDIDDMSFGVLEKLKELRTLLLLSDSGSSITHVPRNFFWSLMFLRTLKLRGTLISELPSSIRNVKELRYLDVSYTPITRLPESVTYLHNLQTLKLRGCVQFDQLPKDLQKLTKLRHIELDIMRQLDSLPANLGNLTHLQTLSAFLVDKDDGCHIGQLKNLDDLKGPLCISRLENVTKVEEAEKASLVKKKCLDILELRWSHLLSTNKEEQEEILEWLEPHCGLKELRIQYYGGSKLPTWISSPSFAVLAAVTLYRCKNCILLPSMGQLPALRVLSITEMNGVTAINHQFFRNGLADDQVIPAFPKLERLEIDIMLNLKEWMEVQKGDLPSLVRLTVDSCPELVTLPSLSSLNALKHLEFRNCPKLQPSDQLPDSLESLMIVDCPRIKEWFHEGDGEEWSNKHRSIWLDEIEANKVVAEGGKWHHVSLEETAPMKGKEITQDPLPNICIP